MKKRKPRNKGSKGKTPARSQEHRNKALHIPLDFDKAVEGLVNVKARKGRPAEGT